MKIIRVLRHHGFVLISQRGSHLKYRREAEKILTVIVPANRKEIPFGTFRSVFRQSQLTEKDFE